MPLLPTAHQLRSRRVLVAGCTANPNGAWVTQQARQMTWTLSDRTTPVRSLIHDRDSKFTRDFDNVFRSEGIEIIRTPFRSPRANAIAERFVGTARRECLDWLLILNSRHLERVLRTFIQHYNQHRPHRALVLTPPDFGSSRPPLVPTPAFEEIERQDLLGGLIHEYRSAA